MKSNFRKSLITISFASITLSVVTLAAFTGKNQGINASGLFGSNADYTVVLDSNNGYISGSSQSITTSSGSWQINFDYTNCSSLANGHAVIANGGSIVNTNDIVSIDYLKFDFDGSGQLKFRTSYDGSNWSGYTQAVDEEIYNLPSNPYYVELSATGGAVNLYSATYQYTCIQNPNLSASETGYQLVTNASDLVIGAKVLFAYTGGSNPISMSNAELNYYRPTTGGTLNGTQFIPATDTDIFTIVDASSVTAGTYAFKSTTDSKYLYSSSSSYTNLQKGTDLRDTSAYFVSIAANGNATLQASSSNTNRYIRYNTATSGDSALKFISATATASNTKNVRLFVEKNNAVIPSDIVGIEVIDTKASLYLTTDAYSSSNELAVRVKYQDGSTSILSSTDYTYAVSRTKGGSPIDKTAPFGTAGTYWVRVTYGEFLPVDIEISVSLPPATITSISASLTIVNYTTADTISYTNNLKATLGYSDGTSITDVSYSEFADYGLSVQLIDPNNVAADASDLLGIVGIWHVRVFLTDRSSVYSDVAFTVSAVLVQDVALNENSAELIVGEQLQLTATITPATATTKSVAWESSNPAIASVNSTGLVSALQVGSATITVTTTDGEFTASCLITVNAPLVGGDYVRVDSQTDITNGKYLIVCESQNVAFDSSLTTLDAVGNTKSVVISSDHKIAQSDALDSALFTIDVGAKTILSSSGYYIYSDSNSNGLSTSELNKANSSITYNSSGVDIVGAGGTYLRYNKASNQTRFRYFKSSTYTEQEPITLFKQTNLTPIYATNISLPANANCYIANTIELTPTLTPSNANQYITWTSNNESVATVSNGVVTGISAGSAVISASTITQSGSTISASCTVTISPISVTGVTLNASSHSMNIGDTFALTPTISPSNASNKNVIWSSSNNLVASVSEGVVTANAVGNAIITCKTIDGNKTASCSIDVEETPIDAWTIMLYMCGSNLESDYASDNEGLATSDLIEIANVTGQPDNVNVIVEAGGANAWSSTYSNVISTSKLNRFHLSNGNYVKDAQLNKTNMGLTSTFQSFLEWGLTSYPAQHTMVILWNHGSGMNGGCCFDENYSNDGLTNAETKNALNGAFTSVGRTEKLDVIGYDCCLMQVQDIADFNSTYFNYMIASQETESGYGWDYDGGWLKTIFNAPTTVSIETFLTACCNQFVSSYVWNDNDQTLSWLNLANMSTYKIAMENLANYLSTNILNTSNSTAFINLILGCKYFGDEDFSEEYTSQYETYNLFDVKDVLTKIKASSTFNKNSCGTYIDSALTALNNLVGYNKVGNKAGNANGLCMWCGVSWTNYYMSTRSYICATQSNFTNWISLWATFGKND